MVEDGGGEVVAMSVLSMYSYSGGRGGNGGTKGRRSSIVDVLHLVVE